MTPPCCKECPYSTISGNCLSNSTSCKMWRRWFKEEWTAIQRAAEAFKAPKETPKAAPKRKRKTKPKKEPAPVVKRRSVCLPRE